MSIEHATESQLSATGRLQHPPSRKRVWIRLVVYVALAGALGLIGWRIHRNQQQAAANSVRQAAALMNRPVPVQVVSAEQKPMPVFLTALGTVTPYMSVTVKARVGGELLPVKFIEGQEVRQGETIMEIDPRPYQAALNQAKGTLAHDQALLNNAKAEFARYKALYAAGVVSKETLDANEASQGQYLGAIESDKAAVENAQLQLSWCSIQSPINGRIGLRLVDPGNIISANSTNLVIINQFRPIAVYFTLPENQLPQVLRKLATDKRVPVDAYDRSDTHKLATGQLLTADNQIDTTTGTARLKAVFNNSDEVLFPNQFVNMHLVMESRPAALVVPSAALQTGLEGASFVWVVDKDADGREVSRIQPVKVALAEGQVTILDSGPAPGTPVVVDGADRLRPGQQVTVSMPNSQTRQESGQMPGNGVFTPGTAGNGQGTGRQGAKEKQ